MIFVEDFDFNLVELQIDKINTFIIENKTKNNVICNAEKLEFMYMYSHEKPCGSLIHAVKHHMTRMYLFFDEDGVFYSFNSSDESYNDVELSEWFITGLGLDSCNEDNSYYVSVGDRVCLTRQPSLKGYVVSIDTNLKDVTTCEILWDGYEEVDVQWTNKLELM